MSMSRCWKCQTTYSGLSCPKCYEIEQAKQRADALQKTVTEHAEAQQKATMEAAQLQADAEAQAAERIAEAQEYAAERVESAIADAAIAQRRTVAEAWKLEADAKEDRAFQLYEAGMYEEAAALAENAIKQDPGNVQPYITAAWALQKLGQNARATTLFQKQIKLLSTSDFRSRPQIFSTVLGGLPDSDELLDSFCECAEQFCISWDVAISQRVVTRLFERDRVKTAEVVISTLLRKSHSFWLHTMALFVLENKNAPLNLQPMRQFLASYDLNQREALRTTAIEFFETPKWEESLSLATALRCLAQQYQTWRPSIQQINLQLADNRGIARDKSGSQALLVAGVVGGVVTVVGLPFYCAGIILGPLIGITIFIVMNVQHNQKLQQQADAELAHLEKAENERWMRVLDVLKERCLPPPVPPPLPA